MRTRARLLVSFVGVHLVLSLVMGLVAWSCLSDSMRDQAQESARGLGRVIAQAGFPVNEDVRAKLRDLTGYQFNILPKRMPLRPGTVQVQEEGKVVEVEYLTERYQQASVAVIVGTLALILAGALGSGIMAMWLSGQFARPIERLAEAARTIGSGDLVASVPAVGSGELGELAGELEHMRQRLRDLDRQHRQAERLATIGTFTATIAHEVRNPLSAVRLTVQLLARRPGITADDPSLTLIMEELERLDLIVDELLGFSKGMQVHPVPCELHEMADSVLRLLRRQAEHAGVVMTTTGRGSVLADPARLRQLLMNLLLNAIQALQGAGTAAAADAQTDGAGHIIVRITSDGFAVCDDGPGVAPERVQDLFEVFSSTRPGGSGLGLHLARAIAEAHGARLAYQAQERGACFLVSGLPSVAAPGSPSGPPTPPDQKGG